MDIVEQLRDLGLLVQHSQANGKSRYYIFEPLEGYTADNMTIAGRIKPLVQYKAKTSLAIRLGENRWWFTRWDYTPGPGPNDFLTSYKTENEALAAALEYFIGEPTVIAGWTIPLHRHPQIEGEQTRQAVQSAKNIPEAEFKIIEQEYASRRFRPDWEGSDLACVFLEVPHQTDEQLVLYLRRDGQEAFVVSTDA